MIEKILFLLFLILLGLLPCIFLALIFVFIINNYYYYSKLKPIIKNKYKDIFDWMTGIDLWFYKQHGGGANSIRYFRLFLSPPKEIAERDDYIELKGEAGFNKIRKTSAAFLWLAVILIINFAAFFITMIVVKDMGLLR